MDPAKAAEMKEKIAQLASPATIPFPNKYKEFQTTPLTIKLTPGQEPLQLALMD
jgi:hypothetical protein